MKHYYYSILSKDYAYKGLLLYNSLNRWDNNFHFFMICLQDEVANLLEKMVLKNVTIITLSDIENEDLELFQVKAFRNDKEYIWTSKASAGLYIFNHFPEVDHIVWLDGDTYFFSSPDPIFQEWGDYSIMLTEERWRRNAELHGKTKGIYNTGFMGFKRDINGLECLNWFRERLIEWCSDKYEKGLWSDQVYVNDWPQKFSNVGIIKNMGINVTPYIIKGCKVRKFNNDIYVNRQKIIFFHYYGFKYFDGNEFELCIYKVSISDNVIKWIYVPYIYASKQMMQYIYEKNTACGKDTACGKSIACKDDMACEKNIAFSKSNKVENHFIRNYFNLRVNEAYEINEIYRVNKTYDHCPHICTIISREYLIKSLVLYNSLKENTPNFHLWICCVDDDALNLLKKMNLDNTTIINLRNFKDGKLAAIEKKRKPNEFCWTLKAPYIIYLLKNNYGIKSILYADADLFFFKDIRIIYDELGENSIFLTKLWMGARAEKKFGMYSAGLIAFKRDKNAFKCLKWWQSKCLKWCYNKIRKGRWSDQKYLDYWPQLFPGIKISENKGLNVGPWNIWRCKVKTIGDTIYCTGYELHAYHYSGFIMFNECEYEFCGRKKIPVRAYMYIYPPYAEEIRKAISYVKSVDGSFVHGFMDINNYPNLCNYYNIL